MTPVGVATVETTAEKQKARRDAGPFGFVLRLNPHDSACFTLSGENGTRLIRTPVASKIALAIAAATGRMLGSPAPVGGSSGWLSSTKSIFSGVSVMSRIG